MKEFLDNEQIYKYDYNEISFNIEDVSFSIHLLHNTTDTKPSRIEASSEEKANNYHMHPFIEVFFNLYEELQIDIERDSINLKENDLTIILPPTNHQAMRFSSSAICFNFSFKKNKLKTNYILYDTLVKAFSKPYIHIKNFKKITKVIELLMASIYSGNLFIISRYFHEFLMEVLIKIDAIPKIPSEIKSTDSNVSRQIKIDHLIHNYYRENITLSIIAKKLNLSERQTARIIKERYGLNLSEIILKKRMNLTATYMKNKKMTITQIATLVGYDSINSFCNAFKKYYGCLPSEYKKRITAEGDTHKF